MNSRVKYLNTQISNSILVTQHKFSRCQSNSVPRFPLINRLQNIFKNYNIKFKLHVTLSLMNKRYVSIVFIFLIYFVENLNLHYVCRNETTHCLQLNSSSYYVRLYLNYVASELYVLKF